MRETGLYMLTEHSPFMMGFVFITKENNAIIVDGGRPEDMPYLFEIVGDRPIAAWILTHPHLDHISGFNDVVAKGERLEQIRHVYSHFPSSAFVMRCDLEDVQDVIVYERQFPLFASKWRDIVPGSTLKVDELTIEFLFVGGECYEQPKPNLAVNESSAVFRVTGEGLRSVLFLGDLGPEGGRDLLRECGEKLPSDIVQMSHHGHSGVTREVYEKIAPTACMWCAPDWLWEEEEIEWEPELWGTKRQRRWMAEMGITEHYVTMNGTQKIPLR